MIRSMTGYGRAQCVSGGMSVTVELKSVNHRYFEFFSRVPRNYGFLDEKLKSYLQSRISRGKVECYVQIEGYENDNVTVTVNHALAGAYMEALKELTESYDMRNDVSVTSLSRYPDVLTVHKSEADEDEVWNRVVPAVEQALASFIAMREREGQRLKEDVLGRADAILKYVGLVEERSPRTIREYNEKLRARVAELIGDTFIEEQRLLTELAIYADKVAVAEETVRLRSHIDQLHAFMDADQATGRKLDFLVQEINREANTIGSKAQDVEITRCVVEIKSEVEKIREQIQNIE